MLNLSEFHEIREDFLKNFKTVVVSEKTTTNSKTYSRPFDPSRVAKYHSVRSLARILREKKKKLSTIDKISNYQLALYNER